MIQKSLGSLLLLLFIAAGVDAQTPTAKQQIRAAVSPAPKQMQDAARVLGYNDTGKLVTLREGSNNLVCLADKPGDNRFHVACYAASMEPFMKRGRELKAQGYNHMQVDSVRKAEIESGKLEYPNHPAALYSLSGPADGFDYEQGKVMKASRLYVVYVPWQTSEKTAISETPIEKGAPWLMEPGTPWAHIMISGKKIDRTGEE